ncbi:MAG: NAD-dependent protein deacylase [Candidatus Hermodarchaeota archaeon]
MNLLPTATSYIRNANHLIALTGAGISKESNVPTFRGKDGLWGQYNAMDLATPQALAQNPKLVWEWYTWRQDLISKCQPNPAHFTLAEWEKRGILKAVITQNVDGLHRQAGSGKVLEVHGDIWRVKCTACSYRTRLSKPAIGIPTCPDCGANLRPDVVWFGEGLPSTIMDEVFSHLERADAIIVIGTSALIQPSASFPLIVKRHGGAILEVNIEATPLTPIADIHLNGKAGRILSQLDIILEKTP